MARDRQTDGQGYRETGCGRGEAGRPEARGGTEAEPCRGGAREITQRWEWMVAKPEAERRTGIDTWSPQPGSSPLGRLILACPGTGLSGSTSLSAGCPWPWESPLSENVPPQLSKWQIPFRAREAEAGGPVRLPGLTP